MTRHSAIRPTLSASALDALWDFRDPKASELRFRRFVRRARDANRCDLHDEGLTQLARAQALQSNFRGARRTLSALKPRRPDLAPRTETRYLLERGRVFNSSGAPRRALPLFRAAWRIARDHGEDALAVDAAHMAALATSGATQAAWNARALALSDSSRDRGARRWRASLLNNIGWSQINAGAYRDALRSFRRALHFRQLQRDPAEIRIARWCVAKALRMNGRTSEALRAQRRLLAAWRRARRKDGYVFEELGECLLALGRSREARPFFRGAYTELSKDSWLATHEPKRLKRLRTLSGASRR